MSGWKSGRRWVVVTILAAGIGCAVYLELHPAFLFQSPNPDQTIEFFAAALKPAVQYEADFVPVGTEPLLLKVGRALGQTILFAASAIGLSIIVGLILGFFASTAWWSPGLSEASSLRFRIVRWVGPLLYTATRIVIGFMRSIHELLWAVLLLVAFGNNHLTAVIAIAIPFSGTLAKIFSEMIDEAPTQAAEALRASGASPLQTFFFGLIPGVFPDLCSYTIYRFECALRSSAILGFFGIPTVGFYLKLSFENLQYREVWTYLYALFALIVIVDAWSGRLRRELRR